MQVFVLGGSWNTFGGTTNDKGAEVLDPAAPPTSPAGGWRRLRGIRGAIIETADPEGRYRADNYGWFFPWSDGYGAHRAQLIIYSAVCWGFREPGLPFLFLFGCKQRPTKLVKVVSRSIHIHSNGTGAA